MIIKHITGIIIAAGFCLFTATAQYAPNVRLNSDVDAVLNRLWARYNLVPPTAAGFQPMTVADLKNSLDKADSLNRAGVLSPDEAYAVQRMRELYVQPRNLAGWTDSAGNKSCYVHLSLLASVAPTYTDSASIRVRGICSPSLTGHIGKLSYYSSIDVWTDCYTDTMFHSSNYQPYNGIPFNLYNRADSAHVRSSDIMRGGITYDAGNVKLETAIDYLRIGPSVYYPLLLSGTAPPITYARVRLQCGPFEYMQLAGQLSSQKDKLKMLYLHRVSVPLFKNRFILGINEAIVSGSTTNQFDSLDPNNALRRQYYGTTRNPEWAYLIPFVPYKITEHYLGDRDNSLMSFDGELKIPDNFRWYGEFLIDDMLSPWKIFTSDWGNKWALTSGMQYFGTCMRKDYTATIEYSRVEPWVYTHFYGGAENYAHFGQCLGMPLGPNSDAFVVALSAQVTPRNALGFKITATRKNASARGGSITDVFQDSVNIYNGTLYYPQHPDNPVKHFLGAGTVSSTRLGITWDYAPFGRFTISSQLEFDVAAHREGVYGNIHGGLVF